MNHKQEEQKAKIINAAMKVLYEQGLNEMTFRSIAAEACISPGTLYYYYNSKDLILYDILNHNTSKTGKLVEFLHDELKNKDEVLLILIDMMRNYVENSKQNMIFLHILHEAISGNTELAEKLDEKYQAWFQGFEDLIEIYFDIEKNSLSKGLAIFYDAMVDGFAIMDLLGIKAMEQPGIKQVIGYLLSPEFANHLQEFANCHGDEVSDKSQG